MSLLGYFDVFPDKQKTELRTAIFPDEAPNDPLCGATFIFTEYFCTDPRCDCQRVMVKVLRVESEDDYPEEVASISYSWNPDSDEIWSCVNSQESNPFLDPFHRQTDYAAELLDFWQAMYERDRAYALRIQRHYDEIRAEIGELADRWVGRHSAGAAAGKSKHRPLSKRQRKARRARLAAARKRG